MSEPPLSTPEKTRPLLPSVDPAVDRAVDARTPREAPATSTKRAPGPEGSEHDAGRRMALALLGASAALKLALATVVTGFVLVDDAYIHLRYARNLVTEGTFVYNPGESVFGLTSPLYGLVASVLFWVAGPLVESLVVVSNVALWTLAGAWLVKALPRESRWPLLGGFLFWPSFVDNQLLGMETPLFVMLLVAAVQSALAGRLRTSACAYGWALITRPEAVLLAPCLLYAVLGSPEGRRAARTLLRPTTLALLLGPGIAWATFAYSNYGGVIPQSMLAKTGWNSEHYDALFTLQSTLLAIPRLSFLPFVDYFPGVLRWVATAGVLAFAVAVLASNVRGGTRASRTWAGFYALYVTFFLVGKGATEASWYSIPSSVALLLAAEPLVRGTLERVGPRAARGARWALPAGLALASAAMAFQRAPLLKSYVEGYGHSADYLNELTSPSTDRRVLIGEIGVYGFRSQHSIIDVGALVSPEVLPMKNAGFSLCRMIQESRADFFVVSEHALETNFYPSVGDVWSSPEERAWLDGCDEVSVYAGKRTYRVPETRP